LIRWSIQEIRRIAMKLAQRRISHAHILAWSSWRRAHQANARKAHLRQKLFAVGTLIAERPPRGSGRAQLRHPALTLGM
jgi:hypothetical protein